MPGRDRRGTMGAFLKHLERVREPVVVETGCQRQANDYGAGMSTTVFGLLLRDLGGRLVSLDLTPQRVELARRVTSGLPVEIVLTDSRPWLQNYTGPLIDGLYLDSAESDQPDYQEVCRAEAEAALPHLSAGAMILIDDAPNREGKGGTAIPWLISQGWRVKEEGYQVLLGRAP